MDCPSSYMGCWEPILKKLLQILTWIRLAKQPSFDCKVLETSQPCTHVSKKAGSAQLEFSLGFGAGLCQETGDADTLSGLELQGRQNDVYLGQLGMSHEDNVPSNYWHRPRIWRMGWKKKVSLTCFSSNVTNPLTASREGLKFCVSAGGMEFGRNKQK